MTVRHGRRTMSKCALVLALFAVCGIANAFLLYHEHTAIGTSEITENFTGTTQTHKVGIKAPANGGMAAQIKLNGQAVASCQAATGGTCCDSEPLTATTYEFYSFAHLFSAGIGKAWVWGQDAQSPPIQLCSGGGGS